MEHDFDRFARFNQNVHYRTSGTPRWTISGSNYTPFSAWQSYMATFGTDSYGDVYEFDSSYSDPVFVSANYSDVADEFFPWEYQ